MSPVERESRRSLRLALIADAYKRMATNDDPEYRAVQMKKCAGWLDDLTAIFEEECRTALNGAQPAAGETKAAP